MQVYAEGELNIKRVTGTELEWINPDDRVPEDGERVILAITETEFYQPMDGSGYYKGEDDVYLDIGRHFYRRDVIAWMPLPVAPKSREEIG